MSSWLTVFLYIPCLIFQYNKDFDQSSGMFSEDLKVITSSSSGSIISAVLKITWLVSRLFCFLDLFELFDDFFLVFMRLNKPFGFDLKLFKTEDQTFLSEILKNSWIIRSFGSKLQEKCFLLTDSLEIFRVLLKFIIFSNCFSPRVSKDRCR